MKDIKVSIKKLEINFNKQFFTYREISIILLDYISKSDQARQQYYRIIEQQKQKIEQENKRLFSQLQESNIKYEVLQQEKNIEIQKKTQELKERTKQLEYQNQQITDQTEKLRKQLLEFHVKYDSLIEEKFKLNADTKDSLAYTSYEKKYQGQLKNYDELKENYNKIYDQYKECVMEIKQLQDKISLSDNKISIIQLQKIELEKKVESLERKLKELTDTSTPRPNLQELLEVAAVYDKENIGHSTAEKIVQVIKNIKIVREVNSKSRQSQLNVEQNQPKSIKNNSFNQSPLIKSQRQPRKRNKSLLTKNTSNYSKLSDIQNQKSKNQLSLSLISNESNENSSPIDEIDKQVNWEFEKEKFSLQQGNNSSAAQQTNSLSYQDDKDSDNNLTKSSQISVSDNKNQRGRYQKQEVYNFKESSLIYNNQINNQQNRISNGFNSSQKQNTKEQFLKYIKISYPKQQNQ